MEKPDEKHIRMLSATASIYTPTQLKTKSLHLIAAMAFQHDTLMVEVANLISNGQSDTETCAVFMALAQDRRQLDCIIGLLEPLDSDYQRASEETVQVYIDTWLDRNSDQVDQDDFRNSLERIFKTDKPEK